MRTKARRSPSERAPEGLSHRVNARLERLALVAARWSSSSLGFTSAALVVVVWLAIGPALRFSESWQLVINTGTTIVTFLMVFLIQRSQSKDALAIQLKLDEIVAALAEASNELVAVEDLSEADLEVLRRHYQALSEHARKLGRLKSEGGSDASAEAGVAATSTKARREA
jgi:low affinity Fe/Cu permease